jgi:hypothetical protein
METELPKLQTNSLETNTNKKSEQILFEQMENNHRFWEQDEFIKREGLSD